jgi:N-ethylmaleimide reductase
MAIDQLLTPLQLGPLTLPNRVWMAPLTRSRAGQPGDVPSALNATYYAQRANAGLIVSEATQVSATGRGYAWTPGIYTDAQQAGWTDVVNAVHTAGGRIALQLWHVGRISHPLLQPDGAAPLAPSAITARASQSFVVQPDGTPANVPTAEPRALRLDELPGVVNDYRQATRRAKAAGFDLVEVHAANGYLLNQFLARHTNQRDDDYGGSLANRARFVLEVVDAAIAEMGADRVGVRLSPGGVFSDMGDDDCFEISLYLAEAFSQRQIAYLHIAEPDWAGGSPLTEDFRQQLRQAFSGVLVYCGGYTAESAEQRLGQGQADAIAFGRLYIANPDLVARFQHGAALNSPDAATFYGGAEKGYTDYPSLAAD